MRDNREAVIHTATGPTAQAREPASGTTSARADTRNDANVAPGGSSRVGVAATRRPGTVLALQGAAGNAAVAGLLARRAPVSECELAPDRVEPVEDRLPDTPAIDEVPLVLSDTQQSEQQVDAITEERKGEVTARFGGMRQGIAGILTQGAAGIDGFVVARQGELQAMTTTALASAQALRVSAVQNTAASIEQARASLDDHAQAVTANLDAQVTAAAGRIAGGIDGLRLPNLPGVSALRAGIRSLTSGAAGVVRAGLGRARALIGAALQSGAGMLRTVLSWASSVAGAALSRLAQVLQNAVRTVAQALRRVATIVVNALRAALNGTVLVGLNRTERSLLQNLRTARLHAIKAIRENRDRHVTAARAGDEGVADAAKENNSTIVTTFRNRTSTVLGQIFPVLTAGVAKLRAHVGQVTSRVGEAVRTATARIVDGVRQAADAVRTFMSRLLSEVTGIVTRIVGAVRTALQHPAAALVSFCGSAATRVFQFLSSLVSRVLRGIFGLPRAILGSLPLRGPITRPRPGPITRPILGTLFLAFLLVGALVLTYAPGIVAAVAAVLAALGITVTPVVLLVIVGVVAVAALILLLLLIYLLYKTLKKPRPKKPFGIKTRTVLAAPDGSARTRTIVGPNEEVEMTASANATWTASVGTITPATGKKVTWTAPAAGGPATIQANEVGGTGVASVTMTVQPPTHRSLSNPNPLTYPAGRSGSGFVAKITIMPTNVAFSRLKVREETAIGVATGYYDTVLKWNGKVHPLGKSLAPDGKNSGLKDTVGTKPPGGPPPFDKGDFHWPIPQTYSVGGGANTQYSIGDHRQDMVDATGTETTSKEGASHTRTP